MRRGSLLVLTIMIVLMIVIGVLLFYIFLRFSTGDTVTTNMVAPATLPAPPDQQPAPPSEPTGASMRLVYIASILIVFVSAVLVLFRMLLTVLIKDAQ